MIAGLAFLILTLYMIGRNRNLLGSSFTIKASVSNVNGLVPGNNVRYKGIDVGTVKSIIVENDSTILVNMIIDEKMRPFIKKNAIASIGTDGLMGNKLININSQPNSSEPVEPGDIIASIKPVETEEMLRTLNTTNNNIERITANLYEISVKLNSSQSLWNLLSDSVITQDLKTAVVNFKQAGSSTAELTATAGSLIGQIEQGDGLAKRLFADTVLSNELALSLHQIQETTSNTLIMIKDVHGVIDGLKRGEGPAGLILSDSVLREKLSKSASNIEQGTDRFNTNMEALKHNFLFRKYFRKLERAQKAQARAQNK